MFLRNSEAGGPFMLMICSADAHPMGSLTTQTHSSRQFFLKVIRHARRS
jgi:hypothetical protein